jgi:hypothetical protein
VEGTGNGNLKPDATTQMPLPEAEIICTHKTKNQTSET